MVDVASLEASLGVPFQSKTLLTQALVHRSYLNENPDFPLPSNERLEFLGDAVLGLIVGENLYRGFPSLSEGEMTRLRASVVCREALARVASSVELGKYLYVGRGEEASGGRSREVNLARALEAVLGAFFLDQGLEAARGLVACLFASEFARALEEKSSIDYKSQLQEWAQATRQLTPVYRMVEERGPDHDKEFLVEVVLGGEVLARGSGKSKHIAEKEAARLALEAVAPREE